MKVNLNTASAEELATLEGIGPRLAERIVEYRQSIHRFNSVVELAAVPGISQRMAARVEADLIIDEPEDDHDLLLEAPEVPADAILSADDDEADEQEKVDEEVAAAIVLGDPPQETGDQSAPLQEVADTEPPSEREEQASEPSFTPPPWEGSEAIFDSDDDEPVTRVGAAPSTAGGWRSAEWSMIAVGATGAIVGVVLTLILLALWNGSLSYAHSDRVEALDQRLIEERDRMAGDLATTEAELSRTSRQVNTLEEQLATSEAERLRLAESMQIVLTAGADANRFLEGMRALLLETTPVTIGAPSPEPTTAEAGATPEPSATAPVTRTPRPTATLIATPTR